MTFVQYMSILTAPVPDSKLLSKLPLGRQTRCLELTANKRKIKQLCFAWLNLVYAVETIFGNHFLLQDSPPRCNGLFLNISHSTNFVACVISDECAVGIDVEYSRCISRRFFEPYFSHSELSTFSGHPNDLCNAWTKKEALLKCLNMGWDTYHTVDIDRIPHERFTETTIKMSDSDYLSVCVAKQNAIIEWRSTSYEVCLSSIG